MRILLILIIVLCANTAQAQQFYMNYPAGYQWGLATPSFYYNYYERPQSRYSYLTEAQRWQMKLDTLEAKEAYYLRRRQVELDKKDQALNNIQRSRDLDKKASEMTPPVRSLMGESWWKIHGHKVQ